MANQVFQIIWTLHKKQNKPLILILRKTKSNKPIRVQVYGSATGGKAWVRKTSIATRMYVNIEQLEIPEEYKALEILYG